MSMRDTMRESAIKGLVKDFDDDLKRLSAHSRLDNKPYITKSDDHLPFINCYMCDSNDCDEIRYGNEKMQSTHIMHLCKDCQKLMSEFLNNQSKL